MTERERWKRKEIALFLDVLNLAGDRGDFESALHSFADKAMAFADAHREAGENILYKWMVGLVNLDASWKIHPDLYESAKKVLAEYEAATPAAPAGSEEE